YFLNYTKSESLFNLYTFYSRPTLKKDIFAKNDKKHFSKSIGIEVITSIAKHNNITPSDIDW
ncbi:hypothetical protein EFR25_06810, partial [Limosilactobacillus fermentum]